MANRTEQTFGRLNPLVNPADTPRGQGGQIDWARVSDRFKTNTFEVKMNGAAIATATTITVDPLPYPLPKGSRLYFGTGEPAITTADEPAGETSVAVEALPTAIEDNDVSYVGRVGYAQKKSIPAFTVLAPTADGKRIPRIDATGSGVEVAGSILASDADEDAPTNSLTGFGEYIGNAFRENLLPDADATTGLIPSGWVTELQANSLGFKFYQWGDDSIPA